MEQLDSPIRDIPKIPSYYHVPWSPEDSREDSFMTEHEWESESYLTDSSVVVTEKLDGSNVRLTRDAVHSRSRENPSHDSFDRLKEFHGQIWHEIPTHIVLYGEWCYAKHSIKYTTLPREYPLFIFLAFNTDTQTWLSWDDTVELADSIGAQTPPVIETSDSGFRKQLDPAGESKFGPTREGYVVRLKREFSWSETPKSIAKCVRENHVQTDSHWKHTEIEPNGFE